MNKWRSRTAESIFKNNQNIFVKSAGTSNKAQVKLSSELINWADKIYVMEDKHKEIILSKFRNEMQLKELFVLNIPDEYQYMSPELIDILNDEMANVI